MLLGSFSYFPWLQFVNQCFQLKLTNIGESFKEIKCFCHVVHSNGTISRSYSSLFDTVNAVDRLFIKFMSDVCAFVFVFRYNELLFIIDTCQGASMYERFYSPNLMALASSQVGEDSLSVSCSHRCRRATFPIVSPFLKLKRCVISQHIFVEDKAVSLNCILCSPHSTH